MTWDFEGIGGGHGWGFPSVSFLGESAFFRACARDSRQSGVLLAVAGEVGVLYTVSFLSPGLK